MNFRIPSTDSNRYRTVKRGPTVPLIILNGANTAADDIAFPDEYCFFKIRLEAGAGLPAGTDLEFMINGGPCYSHNGDPVLLEDKTAPFTWTVALIVGTAHMNLRLSTNATADLTFTITPYERVEW